MDFRTRTHEQLINWAFKAIAQATKTCLASEFHIAPKKQQANNNDSAERAVYIHPHMVFKEIWHSPDCYHVCGHVNGCHREKWPFVHPHTVVKKNGNHPTSVMCVGSVHIQRGEKPSTVKVVNKT